MSPTVYTTCLISACLLFCFYLGYHLHGRQSAHLLKELEVLKGRYRQVFGWHLWFGLYDLESFDGGAMWYALRTGPGGERIIQGEAEKLYPGLLAEHGIIADMGEIKAASRAGYANPAIEKACRQASTGHQSSIADDEQFLAEQVYPKLERRIHRQSICMRLPALLST